MIPKDRGPPPQKPLAPPGPRISTNVEGSVSQARTYQDLLKNAHDEAVFEHHGQSHLVYVKVWQSPVASRKFHFLSRAGMTCCPQRRSNPAGHLEGI